MCDGFNEPEDRDFDSKFLHQLAVKRLFEGFFGFEFAAGEFPEPAEMPIGRALGDEQLAVAEDQAGRDLDWVSRFGFRV